MSELGRAPLTASVPHLLDAAQHAAGPGADNLTVMVMRWGASDPVANTFDLTPEEVPDRACAPPDDKEIERAVAEIRRRMPYNRNGASK